MAENDPNKYQIIQAGSIAELEVSVRIAMLSDWKPLGGVAMDDEWFYQAMAREANHG